MNTKEQFNFLISKLVHNLKRANRLHKEGNEEAVNEIINFSTRELEVAKALRELKDA